MLLQESTVIDGPLPAELLKPASLYHSQVALVPSVPPTTLRVLMVPAQVASSVTLMLVGSTEGVLTVTSALNTRGGSLQSPSALT